MRHPEGLDPRDILAEAESIIAENRTFTETVVLEAAEDIIKDYDKDSAVVNVDLDDEMLEFLLSVYAEESQMDQLSQEDEAVSLDSISNPDYESANTALASKLDLIRRIRGINPGKTPLTLREIHLINAQLIKVIDYLKSSDDISRLSLYQGLYRSLNNAFLTAAESTPRIKNDLIENIIDLEKTK